MVVPFYLSGNWSVSFLRSWTIPDFYTVCLMTKACVSFLPLYYAFNFIRCIKFKYCVFTTFKLYYLRRKNKATTKCFSTQLFKLHCTSWNKWHATKPRVSWSSGTIILFEWFLSSCESLVVGRGIWKHSPVSEVWCSTISGDLRLRPQQLRPLYNPNWAITCTDWSTDSWKGTPWVGTQLSAQQQQAHRE